MEGLFEKLSRNRDFVSQFWEKEPLLLTNISFGAFCLLPIRAHKWMTDSPLTLLGESEFLRVEDIQAQEEQETPHKYNQSFTLWPLTLPLSHRQRGSRPLKRCGSLREARGILSQLTTPSSDDI